MRKARLPRLNSTTDDRSRMPLLLFAGLVVVVGMVHWAVRWDAPIPACGFRTLTGRPCPFCGSTRSFLAWSNLDFGLAFLLNPMLFLASAAICASFVMWLVDRLFYREWHAAAVRCARKLPLTAILTSAVLLNWVYLLLTLPN